MLRRERVNYNRINTNGNLNSGGSRTTNTSPCKSILRADSSSALPRRNVMFDEENVKTTSKRKEAREWCDKGFACLGDDDHDGFLKCIDTAISIDSRYAYPWNLKGVMYAENLSKFEEAIEFYEKALSIDPYYVDAWSNKEFPKKNTTFFFTSKFCAFFFIVWGRLCIANVEKRRRSKNMLSTG